MSVVKDRDRVQYLLINLGFSNILKTSYEKMYLASSAFINAGTNYITNTKTYDCTDIVIRDDDLVAFVHILEEVTMLRKKMLDNPALEKAWTDFKFMYDLTR